MNRCPGWFLRPSALAALLVLITACEPRLEHDPRATHIGTVDLALGAGGVGEGSPDFELVSGLTFDSARRIVVVDAQARRISLYDTAGLFLSSMPPDSGDWCCVVERRGLVWVLNRQANRYAGFAMADSIWLRREQRVPPTPATWLSNRVSFDSLGRLIHVSDAGGVDVTSRQVRHFIARTDEVSRVDTLPSIASADLNRSHFLAASGPGLTVFQQPFGAAPLHAFGPHGEYAFAVSSRYEVFIWSPDLRARRMLADSVSATRLSWSERRSAERTLAAIAERQQLSVSNLPFGIPEHRPVLQQLIFDLRGHLWVVRSVRNGQPSLADVYDTGGTFLGRMTWPSSVSLELGAILDSVALGTTTNAYGHQRVVRLIFKPSNAGHPHRR